MPVSRHYDGHGSEVMSAMKRTYGDAETAKRVFYAKEQKRKNEKKTKRKRGRK